MASRCAPLALLLAALCFAPRPGLAQSVHVRGTVASLTGDTLSLTSTSGHEVGVTLAPNWMATAIVAADPAEIRPGTFVGIAATGPEDHLVAREVMVFPPALKGTGEGHHPWDLGPQGTMTNATIDGEVTQSAGRELTLTYKGGQSRVTVPPDAPVVTLVPGDRSMIKPGAKVFITAKDDNGSLSAARVLVGKDGLTPPM